MIFYPKLKQKGLAYTQVFTVYTVDKAPQYYFQIIQERGLSLYEELEVKEDDGGTSPASLRDAVSLAVPDDTGIDLIIKA